MPTLGTSHFRILAYMQKIHSDLILLSNKLISEFLLLHIIVYRCVHVTKYKKCVRMYHSELELMRVLTVPLPRGQYAPVILQRDQAVRSRE